MSEKGKWIVWRNTPPTRGRAMACSINMSKLNNNTCRWPVSCNPTNFDLSLHVRCWETFNCPRVVGTPLLPASRVLTVLRQNQTNEINDTYQAAHWSKPRKKRNVNVSLPLFAALVEKRLEWVCQLQVSFVQAGSEGHYKSVSDSSNGEWGYI